ncbi:hypothetical protein I6J14_06770 [Streptococcus dysgalactiae]|uniref:hypothetical protein n=1 Tax=Streptococcus dysgalactiae TaxID=1334 RepID=UPI000E089B7B|nr:hypothetical protein [Streptococcus dysgalactiae]QQT03095.1 hypothetical protein I6J14_06770 [Streptococcus dysgalactiae]SUN44255.1 Uncharacterised protein [Streptococcus dysgalactiae subsp. dysgalactiae]SUN48586.1 Uncharacterised protein [Streptococcus dysgalactiae]SUN54582.1 Uncharacterised protein [Streptococcus dysgalactiae]
MKQEKNEVKLTVKELLSFGAELNELTDGIDSANITIESLEVIKRKDPESFMFIISKYLETTYRINEKLSRRIDEIACMLLNADNEKELEGFRNDK